MTTPIDIPAALAEFRALNANRTPGAWCWEQCGEKCDAPVVGIAYHPNDHDCVHPISGELESSNELGQEIDFYRESIAADISAVDGCSASANAAFISAAPRMFALIEQLEGLWKSSMATIQAQANQVEALVAENEILNLDFKQAAENAATNARLCNEYGAQITDLQRRLAEAEKKVAPHFESCICLACVNARQLQDWKP